MKFVMFHWNHDQLDSINIYEIVFLKELKRAYSKCYQKL